jgi:hypothetical protein
MLALYRDVNNEFDLPHSARGLIACGGDFRISVREFAPWSGKTSATGTA